MQESDKTPADTLSLNEIQAELASLLAEMTSAPSDESTLIDASLGHFWGSLSRARARAADASLSVAVLALAKSGKSTLLNALLGAEVLPMNNVPETARICKIIHTSDLKEPVLEEPSSGHGDNTVHTIKGEAAVRARLAELNRAVRDVHDMRRVSLSSASSLSHTASGRTTSLPAADHHHTGAASSEQHPDGAHTSPAEGADTSASAGSGTTHGPSAVEQLHALASMSAASAAPGHAGPMQSPPMMGHQGSGPLGQQDRLLVIRAPIAALTEYSGSVPAAGGSSGSSAPGGGVGGTDLGPLKFHLLDTPGPNEAGEEELKWQVERLLDGVDAVLYLLDYTKLKTQDEAAIFERLKQVNPMLVRRLSQRLFFVVNKVDAAHVSDGQDMEATREYVADLVTRQMGCEGFQLRPEQIVLISARNALLSRLILSGRASPEARARFATLAFGRFADPALLSEAQLVGAANALLADSGILDLEAQVLAFLSTHASAVKQLALVDDLGRLLSEVRNVAASCAAALAAGAEALRSRTSALGQELVATLGSFEEVQAEADSVVVEVTKEIQSHLESLRSKLFTHIITVLDTGGTAADAAAAAAQAQAQMQQAAAEAPVFVADALAAVMRGTPVSAAVTGACRPWAWGTGLANAAMSTAVGEGRWRGVRERFLSIFSTLRSSSPFGLGGGSSTSSGSSSVTYIPSSSGSSVSAQGADGSSRGNEAALLQAAGAAVARTRSKDELASLLTDLHVALTAQIHAEVREFWGVLETVAAARHNELLGALNAHLARLSQQVEAAVSRSLDVRLSPVTLTLAQPDAVTFHCDLEQLLAKGVAESRERHIRVGQRQVVEHVRRGEGICKWGGYWEAVPRVRTVVEAYNLTVYELVPAQVTQAFISMVDSAIKTTESSLETYVSAHVSAQLGEARDQLKQYSHSYLGVMTAALEAGAKGADHRAAALGQVQRFVTCVDRLAQSLSHLQAHVERLVPCARDPIAYDEEDELPDLGDLVEEEGEVQKQEQEEEEEEEGEGDKEAGIGGSQAESGKAQDPPLADGATAAAAAAEAGVAAEEPASDMYGKESGVPADEQQAHDSRLDGNLHDSRLLLSSFHSCAPGSTDDSLAHSMMSGAPSEAPSTHVSSGVAEGAANAVLGAPLLSGGSEPPEVAAGAGHAPEGGVHSEQGGRQVQEAEAEKPAVVNPAMSPFAEAVEAVEPSVSVPEPPAHTVVATEQGLSETHPAPESLREPEPRSHSSEVTAPAAAPPSLRRKSRTPPAAAPALTVGSGSGMFDYGLTMASVMSTSQLDDDEQEEDEEEEQGGVAAGVDEGSESEWSLVNSEGGEEVTQRGGVQAAAAE